MQITCYLYGWNDIYKEEVNEIYEGKKNKEQIGEHAAHYYLENNKTLIIS